MTQPTNKLTNRFEEAMAYAFQLHADQNRKGTTTPYFAHLMSVTALVLEAGGDEGEAIAALLHDAVEDQGGRQTLAEIRRRFGERVAKIVDELTDAYVQPKPPWRKRKEDYLAHLWDASPSVRLVSLADKVHNARSIYRDLKDDGNEVWEKFNGGKEGSLWYYQSLRNIFEATGDDTMTEEFSTLVKKIIAISKA